MIAYFLQKFSLTLTNLTENIKEVYGLTVDHEKYFELTAEFQFDHGNTQRHV